MNGVEVTMKMDYAGGRLAATDLGRLWLAKFSEIWTRWAEAPSEN